MKESKNLGITKACPECRRTLIKSANMVGTGAFHTKCPHCKSLILIEIGQKTYFTLKKVLLILVLLLACLGLYGKITAKRNINCDAFKTYWDAKSAFDSDPIKYQVLDKNNNGVPCEDLLK